MVNIRRPAAVNGVADGGVFGQLVLQVHDWFGPPDEQDGIAVVQLPHLVWGQQFAATLLKIGGPGAGTALGLAVGFGVDGGLAEGLGNVLMGAGFISTEVQNCV